MWGQTTSNLLVSSGQTLDSTVTARRSIPMSKPVVSFRGSVAEDICNKIPLSAKGAALGDPLFHYIRTHANELSCEQVGEILVIYKRTERRPRR